MTRERDEIKNWLRDHGRDYAWLAAELGIAKSTVNGWLSAGKNIPDHHAQSISRICAISEAAEKSGLSIDQFSRAALREKCESVGVTVDL